MADIEDFYYAVEDYAGNVAYAKVEDLINVGNDSGRVTVNLLNDETKGNSYVDYIFIIKDAKGDIVTDLHFFGEDLTTVDLPLAIILLNLRFMMKSGQSLLVQLVKK